VSLDEQRVLVTVTGTKDLGSWQQWRARVGITLRKRDYMSREEEDATSFSGGGGQCDTGQYFEMPRQLARDIVTNLPGVEARVAGMSDFVQQIARDLEQVMVPHGLRAARAFTAPEPWWFVYGVAADDDSGRVSQLAEVCPGLLLMALGLFREHSVKVSQQIIKGVVAGLRLPRLLDMAARAWLHQHLVQLVQIELPGPPSDENGQLVTSQRIRIRRASARVPVELLFQPPPPAMIPGDIPSSPEQNRCWYTYTSHPALPWSDDLHPRMLSERQKAGLSRFLSRWWPSLLASCPPRERDDPAGQLGHIVDYLEATGRVIDRKTSPARLVEDMARWVVDLGSSRRQPPNLPLQTQGLTAWQGPACTIRPLATVAELVDESRTMRHCVASMAAHGVAGHAVYLHGEVHGEPVTIEVRRDPAGGFRITEAKGRDNRSLAAKEWEALACWLDELNEGERGFA